VYDLIGPPKKKFDIDLYLSYDFGKTFKMIPQAVEGDIGSAIKPGRKKSITWNLKKDYPEGLVGDGFIFAVEAKFHRKKRRWPYYLVGAGIVGGFAYFVHRSNQKEPSPNTGTLIITVPDTFRKK
jgi:hypothetical protein